jgi:hypothetical protein
MHHQADLGRLGTWATRPKSRLGLGLLGRRGWVEWGGGVTSRLFKPPLTRKQPLIKSRCQRAAVGFRFLRLIRSGSQVKNTSAIRVSSQALGGLVGLESRARPGSSHAPDPARVTRQTRLESRAGPARVTRQARLESRARPGSSHAQARLESRARPGSSHAPSLGAPSLPPFPPRIARLARLLALNCA